MTGPTAAIITRQEKTRTRRIKQQQSSSSSKGGGEHHRRRSKSSAGVRSSSNKKISPEEATTKKMTRNERSSNRRNKKRLTVDTTAANKDYNEQNKLDTRETEASTPPSTDVQTDGRTPVGIRGSSDLRSPGVQKTPVASDDEQHQPVVPDFITQTDRYGNATTPRSPEAVQKARQLHPTGPEPNLHVTNDGKLVEEEEDDEIDACETLFDSIRLMCCCLVPEVDDAKQVKHHDSSARLVRSTETEPTEESDNQIKLLGKHHPDDFGKKCLVLDLDETLVHSSFRAVPGADFVIPVQIEDVVHFVYVAKRPGVDEFLTEMAKHYEIVVYTASLNKYADPLLDLLDPNRVIRARLFRESCVYYEGNYVKDLSLLDRDLSQAIIIDNSPASYVFHPENAIDCTSFIDDPMDRELDQIAEFLVGVKDVKDVRGVAPLWRDWPNVELGALNPAEDDDVTDDEEEENMRQ